MVQLSHPYMTAGKTIALTIQAFVGKVMSLLLNMLSRCVVAFLPRSKYTWWFASTQVKCARMSLRRLALKKTVASILGLCSHSLSQRDTMLSISEKMGEPISL